MARTAQERRKIRKAKVATRSRPRLVGGGVPVLVIADHRESAAGWTSYLVADTPSGAVRTTVGPFPTARETFHAAMAKVRLLADTHGPAMTAHQLDGSAERWALLAAREGLVDDAGCDSGECRAALVAH